MKQVLLLMIPVLLMITAGCSSGKNTETDPRSAVLKMFRAMENGQRETVAHFLDFPSLLEPKDTDYALNLATPRVFHDPEEILNDLADSSGQTFKRWAAIQKIVNAAEVYGDTAYVGVTFVDKEADGGQGRGYLTKFGLKKMDGVWKIFSFHAD
jgi:hypothetical protein